MEASWKGGCCGAEQSVCLGFADAKLSKKVHDAKLSKKGFEIINVCLADGD